VRRDQTKPEVRKEGERVVECSFVSDKWYATRDFSLLENRWFDWRDNRGVRDRYHVCEVGLGSAVTDAARLQMKMMYERLDGQATDRAEAFGMDLRMWLHLSKTDKVWGWFMIRTILYGQELRASLSGVLKRALYAGVNDGAFKHDLTAFSLEYLAATMPKV